MRTGVCATIAKLPGPVAGLDYLEATVADLLCPRQDAAAFAERLAAARAAPAPVEALNIFLPGELKTTGPDVDLAALDAYVATACRRAGAAGVKIIVFGSGGSRRVPEGFDHAAAGEQLADHLKRWGPLVAAAGVTLALEPLNRTECNIVNSLAEGADLVRRAGHPSIRLLADTYHMAVEGEGPQAIRQAAGLIVHVHCAEGNGRGPLGATGEDHRGYFRALKDVGYDARVSIEAKWTAFQAQLGPALAELRRQIQTA